MKTTKFHLILFFFSFFLAGTPLHSEVTASSETPRATVHGTITDPTGKAIDQATVSVETSDGRVLATVQSNATGQYEVTLPAVAGSSYRERIAAPGFQTAVLEQVVLTAGSTQQSDVRLSVGSASSTVVVTDNETTSNGERATVAQAGILGTLSTTDMPYSVSTYTDQMVADQQDQTIGDVLRNEVGIQETNGRYSEDSYLTLRGFVLNSGNSLLDGLPALVDARNPSIANIERVEIFKGPNSFLNGANPFGNVGGVVNLVTKSPTEAPLYRFDGGYSQNSEFEGHLDLSHRFFAQNALGVRVNIDGRFGRPPVDNQEENVGSASVAADYRGNKLHADMVASDTSRSLLASRDSIYPYPGFAIPKAPKMTSNLFDHSSSYVRRQQIVLARATYTPGERIDLYGAYGYSSANESYIGPGESFLLDADGNVEIDGLPFTSDSHTQTARLGSHINFATGPIQNAVTVAGDYVQFPAAYFYESGDVNYSNIYAPVRLEGLAQRVSGLKGIPDTDLNRNSSIALGDVATAFKGKLIVIGGLRGQWVGVKQFGSIARSGSNTPDFTACTGECSYSKAVVSPSIAGLLHLPKGFSLYSNYMQDLQQGPTAPEGAVNVNQVFAPYVAHQEEVGARYEHHGIDASLAIFRIAQPNGVLNPTTLVYAVTGEQRNRGMEFTVNGNILPSLRLISGISFIDARQVNTGDDTTEGRRAEGIPGTESTVGAEWTVPKLKTLFLDARVTASSGQWADTIEDQNIPAWARLDIGGRYTFKTKIPSTVRVNIDNVTGANFWESAYNGLAYTGPRTVRISGGLRF
jgi:iron complex outermembrane receptor protein